MTVKYNPKFLPTHDELEGIGPDDHHTKFDATDHDGRDHSNIQGIPRNLSELSDVDTSSLADGKVLKWDASSNKFIFADDIYGDGSYNGSGLALITHVMSDAPAILNDLRCINISFPGNAILNGSLNVKRCYVAAASSGSNDRAIIAGGRTTADTYSPCNIIEYKTISSTSVASDFGDISFVVSGLGSSDNGTNNRAVFLGGSGSDSDSRLNSMEYITITSPSNAVDFGDILNSRGFVNATSNDTNNRGIFGGLYYYTDYRYNYIEYFTITSPSNCSYFGDISSERSGVTNISNGTNNRALFLGGQGEGSSPIINNIEYVTITTTSNSQDFGDLINKTYDAAGTSNKTNNRGVIIGGRNDNTDVIYSIYYITISNLGNASYFGEIDCISLGDSATSNA